MSLTSHWSPLLTSSSSLKRTINGTVKRVVTIVSIAQRAPRVFTPAQQCRSTMSSSNGMSPPQRPDIRARQSSEPTVSTPLPALMRSRVTGSFHARALAVSAAHRLASSRSPEPTSATASPLLLPGSAAPPGTQAPFQPQSLSPPKGNPSTLSSVPLSPAKTNGTTSSGSSIDVDIEAGVAGRGAGRHETTGHGVHFHTRSPRSPASPRAKGNGRRSMSSSTGASGDARQRYQWVSAGGGGTGDEPGVDVRSRRDEEAYSHLKGKTHIAVGRRRFPIMSLEQS
jgi:hypothetical protein